MATSYTGKGAAYGLVTSASGTTLGTIIIQSADLKPTANLLPIEGGEATVGMIIANPGQDLEIEGIFVGTTVADALAQHIKTPSLGDLVTITDSRDAEMVGAHSGKYMVVDAGKSKRNTDAARLRLTLRQFTDNDITAAIV